MPTVAHGIARAGFNTQLRSHGQDVVYQAFDKSWSGSVRAVVLPEVRRVGASGYLESRAEVHVRNTDIAQPRKGDKITAGSEHWAVDDYEPHDVRHVLIVRRLNG